MFRRIRALHDAELQSRFGETEDGREAATKRYRTLLGELTKESWMNHSVVAPQLSQKDAAEVRIERESQKTTTGTRAKAAAETPGESSIAAGSAADLDNSMKRLAQAEHALDALKALLSVGSHFRTDLSIMKIAVLEKVFLGWKGGVSDTSQWHTALRLMLTETIDHLQHYRR